MASLHINRAWLAEGYERIAGSGSGALRSLRDILLEGNLRSVRGRIPWRILRLLQERSESTYEPPPRKFLPESYRRRVELAAIAYRRMLSAFRPGLDRIVRLYSRCETLLHLNPFEKHYRDHKLHQLAVTILADRFVTDSSRLAPFSSTGVVDRAGVFRTAGDTWADEIARRLKTDALSPTISGFHHGDRSAFPLGGPAFDAADVRYTLGSAALLHDIGYLLRLPLEQYESLSGDLFPFLDAPLPVVVARVRGFLKDSLVARWIEDRMRKHFGEGDDRRKVVGFEADVLPWFVRAVRNRIHGAASCAFLLDHLHEWRTHGDIGDRAWFCLQWAALAILRHDLIDLSIDKKDRGEKSPDPEASPRLWDTAFADDPISFFLILADNLHESFRHKLEPEVGTGLFAEATIRGAVPCPSMEIERSGNKLTVRFVFEECYKSQAKYVVKQCKRIFKSTVKKVKTDDGEKWSGWAPFAGFVDGMEFARRLV